MEDELWKEIYRLTKRIGKCNGVVRGAYSDVLIVAVYFWAVIHDRPNCWACQKKNWRGRGPRHKLPSESTLSRRLRSENVLQLIKTIEQKLIQMNQPSLCRFIDAKPLVVSGHSEDRDVGYGRASSSMARGYKFHGIYDRNQGFVQWKLTPMNCNETPPAVELISRINDPGYLIGDNAYDRNKLYDIAGERGVQLIAPQQKNAKALGHRRHSPYRLKAIEMQTRKFARQLVRSRRIIETAFGQLTTLSFGLGPLPNWVRTHRRVENWIRAKLITLYVYRFKQRTYAI